MIGAAYGDGSRTQGPAALCASEEACHPAAS